MPSAKVLWRPQFWLKSGRLAPCPVVSPPSRFTLLTNTWSAWLGSEARASALSRHWRMPARRG